MSPLSREECIELGLSIPTGSLTGWVTEQLAAAKGMQKRLEGRGLIAPFLKEIKTLVGTVARMQLALGDDPSSIPEEAAPVQQIREEACAYLQEARQIVKIEFGSCPEIQGRFRPGVRTGRLLSNLLHEMDCVVSVLREQSPQLRWLGVDDSFIDAGEALKGRLREAQSELDSVCEALSPDLAEQCCVKGKLYDLARKLVRIGRLEFLHEPERAAAFNYSFLRKGLQAGPEVRARISGAVAR